MVDGALARMDTALVMTMLEKLQKSLSTFEVTFDTESTTRVSSYTESMYPTSVDVFLNRLQTSPTRPISPASDTPVIGQVHVIRGLNDAAIAGIIVSSIVAVLMLLLGLYFFIRRQRNKRARNQQDSSHHKPTDDSLLELAEKSDVHEADAERHKAELPSNRNEAWELEDTSYTPELCPSHGLSEMEVHSGIPTKMEVGADTLKEARELPLVARTPISPSGTVETAQNPAQTPTPVSPLDKPNTTKSTPQNTLTISPIDTPGTTQKPPQF
ncbi:hypothetical protein B0T21DRAFT_375437 [Apiosordaria backusii]|uniref:Uncharacterized protein n=1 Tax=Apiosordaria backusii TaxID=314023 RepID=A0AA40DWE2_9PEZI|nr:hypothetical protein B0T21DRAFT_375437 [Apiosordaria backusii]